MMFKLYVAGFFHGSSLVKITCPCTMHITLPVLAILFTFFYTHTHLRHSLSITASIFLNSGETNRCLDSAADDRCTTAFSVRESCTASQCRSRSDDPMAWRWTPWRAMGKNSRVSHKNEAYTVCSTQLTVTQVQKFYRNLSFFRPVGVTDGFRCLKHWFLYTCECVI